MKDHVVELDPDAVHDRESFVQFVEALIAERAEADALESKFPEEYRLGGAAGWQNSSIASFLECALSGAIGQEKWGSKRGPSWRDFAVFLYLGKVYE
ncbi:MAG TPA: hypothetical protein VF471_03205 [Pseudoxanthomonas sp.]